MSAEPKKPVVGTRGKVVLVLALLGVLYGGYRFYLFRKPYEWSGTVEARTISVGSRAGGRVKEVLVKEGARVAKGESLVTLEPADWPAQLMQAEAQLAQAQANLDKLKQGARPEEIEQARARAVTAKAAFEQARAGSRPEQVAAAESRLAVQELAVQKVELEAQRMAKLDQAGAAVPAEVDNAKISVQAAIAQRDATKQQLEELRHGSRREELDQARGRQAEQIASEKLVAAGSRTEDIRVAAAQVDAARGHVDQIKSMIDELAVRAPLATRVEALDLRPGDILAPNAIAAVLLEENQLYLRIYVPETLLGRIKIGQEVSISVDSFPHQSFRGVVEHINAVGEYSPRNLQTADERADQVFATRVGLKTGFDELRAGMAAFIQVPK
ncbi:MAG TPA: efflux RND transporter periplasmic adaptor subunit [Polyangiaceae bacterium]|jgi:multidrug resistance efflux pump|nr:efflux RND transporter periplasmic adaptor subunit [Polyangiaceae bacterium]